MYLMNVKQIVIFSVLLSVVVIFAVNLYDYVDSGEKGLLDSDRILTGDDLYDAIVGQTVTFEGGKYIFSRDVKKDPDGEWFVVNSYHGEFQHIPENNVAWRVNYKIILDVSAQTIKNASAAVNLFTFEGITVYNGYKCVVNAEGKLVFITSSGYRIVTDKFIG